MKRFFRRAAALLLSGVLLSTTAFASVALGSELYSYTIPICDGTTLSRQVIWSASKSDLRTENYVTYKPSSSVSPKVSYGSSVLAKQTVGSMAKDLESKGNRVLSGINGDFFVVATGNPLGIVITDGILRSSASYLSAVGFHQDGTAVIGKPDLSIMADFKGYSLKVSDINKTRDSSGGYYLYTDDFGSTTKNTSAGIDVILSPVTDNIGQAVTGADGATTLTTSGSLGVGRMVTCTVDQVLHSSGSIAIPQGKFVLSIGNGSGDWLKETLLSLQSGDTVQFEVSSADTRWNKVDCAVGAMYWILSGGVVASGLDASDPAAATAAPRTAVGVKPDGSTIFYTIDGRQSGLSVGATVKMVAQRLLELGCTDAVCLDGGGSTTFISTYPDYTGSTLINSPSDGPQRAVTNAVFLVSNLQATGIPGSLYVTPKSLTLLSGASTQCVASCMDTGWYPMASSSDSLTWSASGGTVSDTGVFTAPSAAGVYTVSAQGDGISGSTAITVFQTPDAIEVKDEATGKAVSSFSLTPGQSLNLTASAAYRSLPLTCTDSCFTWTADASLGTITSNGVFTAGNTTASGNIKVAAGNYAITFPVTVSAPSQFSLLTDFEGDSTGFSSSDTGKASLTSAGDLVKYGQQSLCLDYTLSSGAASITGGDFALDSNNRCLSLWVYGDNSGNTLSAAFTTASGAASTKALISLNYTGWKQVWADLPSGVNALTGFTVTGSQTAGKLSLDQLLVSNQKLEDIISPSVSLTVSGSTITAAVSDNETNSLEKDRIALTVDGSPVDFFWNASSGNLTATLPGASASLHRITVTVTDLWGNIGRDSVTINSSSSDTPFADMTNHWAKSYTTRLNELGIITGVTESGTARFYPNNAITRGDFALITARWLGLKPDDYAGLSLPYADSSAIPAWDLNAVKALYSLGIMQGSSSGGKLYANASSSITRAEAMTILGRIQEKGYAQASLSAFTDAASIPSWAKSYVAVLVGQGVVNGSNSQLRPQDSVSRAEVAKMLLTLW